MRKNYHDENYVPSNREKVSAPKKGLSWCACDKVQIGDWVKCPVCGHRNGRKRLKP